MDTRFLIPVALLGLYALAQAPPAPDVAGPQPGDDSEGSQPDDGAAFGQGLGALGATYGFPYYSPSTPAWVNVRVRAEVTLWRYDSRTRRYVDAVPSSWSRLNNRISGSASRVVGNAQVYGTQTYGAAVNTIGYVEVNARVNTSGVSSAQQRNYAVSLVLREIRSAGYQVRRYWVL